MNSYRLCLIWGSAWEGGAQTSPSAAFKPPQRKPANRRKSAVELLAASRPRYVKSAALLDDSAVASTPDRHYRSICQPIEKPPVRSKSEFDVSKLHELLAQEGGVYDDDDVDGNDLSGDDTTTRLSDDLRPLSARSRERGEEEEKGEGRSATTPPGGSVSGGGGVRGEGRKINSAADRQDESQRFFRSAGNVAASASVPAHTPPPVPPKPVFVSASLSNHSSTQTPAPAVYTARPIYINLAPSPPHPHPHAAQRTGNASDLTPVNRTIRVIPAASHVLSPPAMSEESLDKTPTNPTGGDLTGHDLFTPPAPVQEGEGSADGERVGGSTPSTPVTSVDPAPPTSSPSPTPAPTPAPRLSLRGSGEFVSVGGSPCNFNPVPRSFSDISCRHSQAGSDVSSGGASRASRSSTGANLERFFNEMGLERDILDPMIQLQHRRYGGGSEMDIYDSISSLESHGDARSICSALSRSEKEISDSESFERSQQQTSVVERNARIIKWLCNVRKAKTPATTSVQGSAAS
ncbi:uncharacterized protein LOC143280393 [Babylonia areolata]|uniref:uncharacterized protein LOC143280393 n=1 Tax=Babylonia areolata TaxID=304850 RepID=UPI003FD11D5B